MSSNLLTLCAAIFKATTQWKEVVLRAYLRGDALRRTRTIEADQDHRGGPGPSRRTRTIEADQDQRGDTSRTRRPRKDEVYQCVGRGRTSEATEEEQRVGRGGQGRTRCTRESDVEGRARRRRRTSEATEEDERGDVGGRARRLGRTTVGEQRGGGKATLSDTDDDSSNQSGLPPWRRTGHSEQHKLRIIERNITLTCRMIG
ncbi:uncharacterized protein LOC142761111 [Rhinoderma darwinii]|uniref:uncharacterized protein LOC142761111 n=1 Tax=Rhinoderma darwinii TaxID=43563 RepID=UPI003F6802BC